MRPLLSLVPCALLLGCNAHDAADLSHDAGRFAKTAVRSAGNAQLAGRVYSTLAERKGVDVSGLHVDSEGGTVTLSGHVRTAGEKRTVRETVDGIRGVDKVVDKLRIGG